jgi:MinD-like ATPase involved in chromosome partitioning or flagellar assembly
MSQIIAIHSFRGGTGKSNITANIAALLVASGRCVGIVDTDVQSPGIHVLFGVDVAERPYTLNDYLWGGCDIAQTAYDVTAQLGPTASGRLWLVPASSKVGEIARVLRQGYDVNLLNDGFHTLLDTLALDVLLIDTHPGLNEETVLSMAVSDALAIILRPDQQDYQGTGVAVDVARKLDVPRLRLIVNKVPPVFEMHAVKARVEQTYQCEVAAVLPHAEEMMVLASSGLFVLRYPDHPITHALTQAAARLIE